MRIVAATDLTERSDRALDRALRLLADGAGQLSIIHVVDDGLPDDIAAEREQEALGTIRDHLAAADPDVAKDVFVEIRVGSAWDEVVRCAIRERADLIVVGIPRPVVLRDLLSGTTAERILRNSSVPVLAVTRKPTASYADVVLGADFSVPSRMALEFAVRLAPTARVHMVHAYDIPFRTLMPGEPAGSTSRRLARQFEDPIREQIEAFNRSLSPALARRGFRCVVREGDVVTVLRRQVRKLRSPLLVLGTHGRTGLARAFMGSTTEAILSDPPCDVLAVKAW